MSIAQKSQLISASKSKLPDLYLRISAYICNDPFINPVKRNPLLLFICLLFSSSVLLGQVNYTAIPMDSQLVARNLNTNLGTFNVQGVVDSVLTPYDTISLKIYRDSSLVDSIYQCLHFYGDSAPFSFSFQIPAELHEYSIRISGIKNNLQTPDTSINGLLAGDVFIIEGQSNALAMERDGQNADTNKSEFIRSFGNSDSSTAGLLANLAWFRGEGNGAFKENGHVGQWGLRLGHLLVDSIKIPVAIFNGACGGTPISYYERPGNYKTNINSNYARLYYRLTLTGLQNNIRAIIWSQGESDAAIGTSTASYINQFTNLQKAWQQDYPGFRKIYIFQTKTETIEPLYNIMNIEEAEREIAMTNAPAVEIMSTSALKPDSGGLHFDYTGGYEEFGNRVYELIARDIYNVSNSREIDAPYMLGAFLSDSVTLVIPTSARSLMQHNPALSLQTLHPVNCYQLENAVAGTQIDSIYTNASEVILSLCQYPGKTSKVSYLAPINDTGTNWVTNTNGLDMVCFYLRPVADSIRVYAGIEEMSDTASYIKIYPNPCFNYTNVLLPKRNKYYIELDDLKGRQLRMIKYTGYEYMLSTDGLSRGIYLVRIFDKKRRLLNTTKLAVE